MSDFDFDEWFGIDENDDINTVLDKQFMKQNVIFLDDGINQSSIGLVCKKLKAISQANKKDILLHVNTNGGCVYEFLRLYDTIRQIPNKVHIYGQSRIFSAGAWIVACAATGKRYCNPHSNFMFHQVSSIALGKLTDLENDVDETRRLHDILVGLLKKHTKLKKADFEKMMHKDYYFDAQTAKKLKVVDKVL